MVYRIPSLVVYRVKTNRNLDILRAIAVLLVLFVHLLPASEPQRVAGHYAVLIFFVHTALVLLLSLERQVGQPGLVRRFYIQRAFRIYPLSVLCVLVTLAFHISWPDNIFTPPSGGSIIANLLLVQNFFPSDHSISAPLWSLPFEVQMYLVLPAIFWILRRHSLRGAIGLTALSVALPVAETLLHHPGGPITIYAPCFMGGALAYFGYGARRWFAWWWWPLAVAVLGYAYWATGYHVVCRWAACILLGVLVPRFREAPDNPLSKAANLVARYSYGIYLSHAPLLWLCFQRVPNIPMAARWLLFSALVVIVPVGLYHLFEEPMIRTGKALSRTQRKLTAEPVF